MQWIEWSQIIVWPIGRSKCLSPTMKNGGSGPLGQSNMDPLMCDLHPWISVLLYFLCATNIFTKSQICALLVTNRCTITNWHTFSHKKSWHSVPSADLWFPCLSGIQWSGQELLYRWTICSPHTTLVWWCLSFEEKPNLYPYACILANKALKMACYEKRWFGTTRIIKYGPHICDLRPWIDALLHSLYGTQIFTNHKSVHF